MSNTPSIGRIVHILVDPSINNGADVAPAVITRVWGDTCVNVRVLLDNAPGRADEWATSRYLKATEAEAREAAGASVALQGISAHAFWPPRI